MNLKVGMKVQTRNGRAARIIADDCNFGRDSKTIIALVKDKHSGTESPLFYYADGHYFSSREDYDSDLILMPDHQHTFYVYSDGSCTFVELDDHCTGILGKVVIKVIGNTVTSEVVEI